MSNASDNNRLIKVYLAIAFIIMAGISAYSYLRMRDSLDGLVETVKSNSRPDENLIQLKELWSEIQALENDVRTYSITGDDVYFDKYVQQKDSLRRNLTRLSLVVASDQHQNINADTLRSKVETKFGIYDSLLHLSYNRFMKGTLSELEEINLLPDSSSLPEDDGTVLQKLFSSKYSRRKIKAQADSIIEARDQKVASMNTNLTKLRNEEEKKLAALKEKEIQLLARDKIVSAEIESIFRKIEAFELSEMQQLATASERSTDIAAGRIKNIVAAALVVLSLIFILLMREISVSGKRKKQLEVARKKAEMLADAKEKFMATMSHEIRTPLTSIIGYAGKLDPDGNSTEQGKYIKAITGSSDHLLSIVNDVLDFTRVETGKLNFKEAPFTPFAVIEEVIEALQWKSNEKGIYIRFNAAFDSRLTVNGDQVRFRQVIFNIVGNAVKFTESGGVTISSAYLPAEAKLNVVVSDTGIGIPDNKLDSVFEEFTQADQPQSIMKQGSGLGLTISKKIIEQQGGTITVKSALGKGTVFTIDLPFQEVKKPAGHSENSKDVIVKPSPLEGKLVLLAEDDPLLRDLQVHSLKHLGAEVLVAEDGGQALRILDTQDPDLIIIDMQMPGWSGNDVVRVLRTGFAAPKSMTPVIGISANVLNVSDQEKWKQDGFDAFLGKPFSEDELIETAEKVFAGKKTAPAFIKFESKIETAPSDPLYNLASLRASANDNPEFVDRMQGLFLTTAYASLNNLKFYLNQTNWEQLGRTAHRMIGSYKQMGVTKVVERLKRIEYLTASTPDARELALLVDEIENISSKVFDAIKSEMKT